MQRLGMPLHDVHALVAEGSSDGKHMLAAAAEHQRHWSRTARLYLQSTSNGDLGKFTRPTGDRHDLELPAREFGHMPDEQFADQDGIVRASASGPLPRLSALRRTDIAGCFDPEYVWHDLAQVWQTPGAGEAAIAQQLATPAETRAKAYEALGMAPQVAAQCAAAFSPEMGRCILALYRSAAQPRMAEWGADLSGARGRPGLVIIPSGSLHRR